MVTVQVLAVLVQAPLHPANVEPAAAAAVKVTGVPLLYSSVQSLPQWMPAGDDVTVPDAAAVPALVTVNANELVNGPTNPRSTRFRPVTLPPPRVSLTVKP